VATHTSPAESHTNAGCDEQHKSEDARNLEFWMTLAGHHTARENHETNQRHQKGALAISIYTLSRRHVSALLPDLTRIRRRFVSSISTFAQGNVPIKRKHAFFIIKSGRSKQA
jgi:hypothetical protein